MVAELTNVESLITGAQTRLTAIEHSRRTNSCKTIKAMKNLADLYITAKRYSEAEPVLLQIIRIQQSLFGIQNIAIADTLISLGDLYDLEKSFDAAEGMYARAALIIRSSRADNASELFAQVLLRLHHVFRVLEKMDKAKRV